MYAVRFHPSAVRELEQLDSRVQKRVARAVGRLANDPHGGGAMKLRGAEDLWPLRVGDYRVIYQVRETTLLVLVIRVCHRREAYR